jgi:predicted transcriptional regulator
MSNPSATTTIRLSEELKARVASAAERSGKTTHSFILEAIAEKAEQEEARAAFDMEADARFANIVATGKTVPWKEARAYLQQRLAGQQPARPAPVKKRA